jgi:hypothetical protein
MQGLRDDCETLVFRYDSPDQRAVLMDMVKPYWNAETGLRVVAMSIDNEVSRMGLVQEALERYTDRDELRDAIDAVLQCADLRHWSWDKHDELDG